LDEIFISYRRDDAGYATATIHRQLSEYFGSGHVFRDNESLHLSEDYPDALWAALRRCQVLVAVMGPRWLGTSVDGRRRMDDPKDWVRRELEQGLRRGIPIAPVRLDDAPDLASANLPAGLGKLVTKQATRVRQEAFADDVHALAAKLGRLVPRLATVVDTAARQPAGSAAPTNLVHTTIHGGVHGESVVFGMSDQRRRR